MLTGRCCPNRRESNEVKESTGPRLVAAVVEHEAVCLLEAFAIKVGGYPRYRPPRRRVSEVNHLKRASHPCRSGRSHRPVVLEFLHESVQRHSRYQPSSRGQTREPARERANLARNASFRTLRTRLLEGATSWLFGFISVTLARIDDWSRDYLPSVGDDHWRDRARFDVLSVTGTPSAALV